MDACLPQSSCPLAAKFGGKRSVGALEGILISMLSSVDD